MNADNGFLGAFGSFFAFGLTSFLVLFSVFASFFGFSDFLVVVSALGIFGQNWGGQDSRVHRQPGSIYGMN